MSKIKKWLDQKKKAQDKLLSCKTKISKILEEQDKAQKEIKDLDRLLSNFSNVPLTISNHALMRYAERSLQINFEQLREHLTENETLKAFTDRYVTGKCPLPEHEVIAVIQDKNVVTFLPLNS